MERCRHLGKAEAGERRYRYGPRPEGSSGYVFLKDTSQLVFVAPVDSPTSADSLVLYKQGSAPGTGVTC